MLTLRRDSFSLLREGMRWRVALFLSLVIAALALRRSPGLANLAVCRSAVPETLARRRPILRYSADRDGLGGR